MADVKKLNNMFLVNAPAGSGKTTYIENTIINLLAQYPKLNSEVIQSIMEEEKPNQKEKPAFRDERITKLIPKTVPRGQETDFVVKALEFYNRHLQRNKAHER